MLVPLCVTPALAGETRAGRLSELRMHKRTVTSKHFDSSNPLPFEQRRFRVQVILPC
jgi:hypothetical protein